MLSRFVYRCNSIGFHKYKMFHQSAICMDKAIVAKMDNDSMIATIKSASNSYELLNVISKNAKQFSSEQTLTALKTLFELQKHKTTSINRDDIVRNSVFERLCRSLKRNARKMELNDVIEALKIVIFVGIESKSEIIMSLLHLIKYQINDVSLGHIVFLNFLIRQMEPNPLGDALLMALPMLLQIQIGTKIDYDNVAQLTDLLIFVSRNRVNDQCIMNIVNALTMHGVDLNVEQSRSIIWSLSSTSPHRIYNPSCERLLENSIKVMKRDFEKEDFSTICTTLDKMVDKYLTDPSAYQKFYDETLFNKFADFVVMNDLGFENATFLLRHLNKLGFVNIKLLKYMLSEGEKYPSLIVNCRPISLTALVTALSQANYKPDNWDKMQSLILRSNVLRNNKRLTIPWTKLASELLSLGIECPSIWDTVFSKDYIRVQQAQDQSQHLLNILRLYQNLKVMTNYDVDSKLDEKYLVEAKRLVLKKVSHPMQEYMESAFGGPSFVYTKVRTQLGQIIDHVIAFDKETMEPIRIEDGRSNHDVLYEDITCDDIIKQYIAVVVFPRQCYCINIPILRGIYELKLRTFEKMGITVVLINHSTWDVLQDFEKIPYIQREVRLKLTQIQSVSVECQ